MISEAYKDSWMTDDPRRVCMPAFNGSHAGVMFVDGVNTTPMPAKTLRRLVTAGVVIEDLGPWSADTPSEPASPASEPPPSTDAGDAAPDPSTDAEPADAGDGTTSKPRRAR